MVFKELGQVHVTAVWEGPALVVAANTRSELLDASIAETRHAQIVLPAAAAAYVPNLPRETALRLPLPMQRSGVDIEIRDFWFHEPAELSAAPNQPDFFSWPHSAAIREALLSLAHDTFTEPTRAPDGAESVPRPTIALVSVPRG